MKRTIKRFDEIWNIHFVSKADNIIPEPLCLVAVEVHSGEINSWNRDELQTLKHSPFPISALIQSWALNETLRCFIVLGWSIPNHMLSGYVFYRHIYNPDKQRELFKNDGEKLKRGEIYNLHYRQPYLSLNATAATKNRMYKQIQLHPYRRIEEDLKIYAESVCKDEINAIDWLHSEFNNGALFPFGFNQVLDGSRYAEIVAIQEMSGIPIDMALFNEFKNNLPAFRKWLIEKLKPTFNIFVDGKICKWKFDEWVKDNNYDWWPVSDGDDEHYSFKKDAFDKASKRVPELKEMSYLKTAIDGYKPDKLSIDLDGRNRYEPVALSTITGRNAPSTNKSILQVSSWNRYFINPPKGKVVAQLDYEQQEFVIAAVISKDHNMKRAYTNLIGNMTKPDAYRWLGFTTRFINKRMSESVSNRKRTLLKSVAMAIQYGSTIEGIMDQLGIKYYKASEIYDLHKVHFAKYHKWKKGIVAQVKKTIGPFNIYNNSGWGLLITNTTKNGKDMRRAINFYSQSLGASMMQSASRLLIDEQIKIIGTLHDAVFIEVDYDGHRSTIDKAKALMEEASSNALNRIMTIRVEEKLIYNRDATEYTNFHYDHSVWKYYTDFIKEKNNER